MYVRVWLTHLVVSLLSFGLFLQQGHRILVVYVGDHGVGLGAHSTLVACKRVGCVHASLTWCALVFGRRVARH
jgi:hypothetical protein